MTVSEFREMALSFQGTIENPHFDRAAFKVLNKKIFATLHEESKTANLKFNPEEQATFCAFDKKAVSPVPNKWGLQGWTTFQLEAIPNELMLDALNSAYQDVLNTKRKKK
jgi:predicted DNA-binding protein (MmcQ/YjbR family)